MSIATQIERIQTDRDTIRAKAVQLGIAQSNANLDDLATAIAGIENQGAVSAQVQEGQTYTIPKGYHNGSGTVSGVAGGGNYTLQSKTVEPTKKQQNITPDSGYYGLSDVTVEAIPVAYQDVSSVTASAGDVLTGKTIVTSAGTVTAGTMPNNGAVSTSLNISTTSYTIPAGYHNGSGKVSITPEEKSATPTTASQEIVPTSGRVLSKVTVNPIPENFANVTDATAVAENILDGVIAYGNTPAEEGEGVVAVKLEGTMPNNGSVKQTLTTTVTSYTIPKGYHDGTGAVSITTETKSATPSKSSQNITPTTGRVLSSVTVAPIPAAYQDVTNVTATAEGVLTGQVFVSSEGEEIAGTMPNNGGTAHTLDTATTSYTIPEGYHNGEGTVSITTQTKNATPTKSQQTISADTGKVLSSVTVAAIPAAYQDVSEVTVTAGQMLTGAVAVGADGTKITGTMANNGATNLTIDGLSSTSVSVPAGYTTGGTVSLTSDIEDALAAI